LARAVGLDVGARHVRLVEVDGSARGLRLTRLGEREFTVPEGGDREEAIREAVDALFKDTRAGRDEVVLSWPGESCTVRELSVPFREPDQIRKVVKYEFESHLHANAIEDVVLDFLPTGDTKEGARLLCFAAPKAPLRARLESLGRVRIDPVTVDLDATALVAAAAGAGILVDNPDCVLVDLGARSTKIVVVHAGRVRAARAFLGTTESPAPSAPAEAAPSAPGAEGGAAPEAAPAATGTALAVEDRSAAGLARVAREVTRTLANAAPGVAFPVCFVSGRGSLAPGARDALARDLGMEVRPLDLLSRITHPVPAEQAEETGAIFATALGAAARALGAGPAALDLRREDLAYARRFDQVKGGVAAGLVLLLLAVGFLLWRAKTEKDAAARDFDAMVSTLHGTSEKVEKDYKGALGDEQAKKLWAGSGKSLDAVPDANRRLKQMHEHLLNDMGLSTEVPPIRTCLKVMKDVNLAIKSVRDKLDYCLVTKADYSQKEVRVEVRLSAPEHADIVLNAFRDLKGPDGPLFKDPIYDKVAQGKDGKWPVTFILRFEAKK
jgi:hypothetical protein